MATDESETMTQHEFEECPDCGGQLQYQTDSDVLCLDCEDEFSHEIRTTDGGYRHLLWDFGPEYHYNEVVADV